MKKLICSAAIAAAFVLPAAPARADAACQLMGSLMRDSVLMRERGYTQRQTANALSAMIGDAASNGPGSRAERQAIANEIGRVSTYLLQFAYSVELHRGVDNAGLAGQFIYNKCMRGEI